MAPLQKITKWKYLQRLQKKKKNKTSGKEIKIK